MRSTNDVGLQCGTNMIASIIYGHRDRLIPGKDMTDMTEWQAWLKVFFVHTRECRTPKNETEKQTWTVFIVYGDGERKR
jgi:hypothetical protein